MTQHVFNSTLRFRVNKPKVLLETFDDEVVMVNLDNGNYYCLQNVGAEIWGFLEQGAAIGEIIDAVIGAYDADHSAIETAIFQFLTELRQEELLVPVSNPNTGIGSGTNPSLTIQPSSEKRRFQAPILEKFTDMQEMLLLDPIHEVDETGWPYSSKHAW